MDGLLVEDAARRIGIPPAQVRRLVRTGRIRVRNKQGTFLLLEAADVEREAERYEQTRQWIAHLERM